MRLLPLWLTQVTIEVAPPKDVGALCPTPRPYLEKTESATQADEECHGLTLSLLPVELFPSLIDSSVSVFESGGRWKKQMSQVQHINGIPQQFIAANER